MRIALLHYTLPPVVGGVEAVLATQAEAFRQLGHEVTLLDRTGWEAECRRNDGTPEGAEESVGVSPTQDGVPFEIVLVHNVMTMPFDPDWRRDLIAQAARHPQVGWVSWVHDLAVTNPAYADLDAAVRQELTQTPPGFRQVTVSEARRREMVETMRLKEEEIAVVRNGVSLQNELGLTDRISEWVREVDLKQLDWVLLHPARWVRRKRVDFGVEVAAELVRLGWRGRHVITGATDPHQVDGERYRREVLDQVGELKLSETVDCLGMEAPLSREDLRSLYRLADALFFPSASEGFGLPLIESQAHRLPVWCSDLPVHREVLGGAGNYFAADAGPEEVAEALAGWLREGGGQRRRQLLGMDSQVLAKEALEWLLEGRNEGA